MNYSPQNRIASSPASESVVLENCRYLLDIQVWPAYSQVAPTDPELWLSNFTDHERPYAVQMLAAFHYFPEQMVEQMLRQAILEVFATNTPEPKSIIEAVQITEDLLAKTILTRVEGETPSDADSGFRFMRRARQILEFPEQNMVRPDEAIRLVSSGFDGIVLFLDDIVGSGDQCISTWKRRYSNANGLSFSSVAKSSTASFIYCPLIATDYGVTRISQHCDSLVLKPLHQLPENYSLLSPESFFWPDNMRIEGQRIIAEASRRAGLMDLSRDPPNWRGHHDLGLAIAIGDCIPDITLPIFYYSENWHPLMRRT